MTREDKLLKKLEYGDMSALDELISLYYADILRYCICHTKDRQTAEDAVQETFLKTVRYLDRYVHKGKFRAFLYQVAANTCVDMWRKNTRRNRYRTLWNAWSMDIQGRDRDGFYTFDQRTVPKSRERSYIFAMPMT